MNAPSENLFRKPAVDHARGATLLGTVIVPIPLSARLTAAAALLVGVTLVLYLSMSQLPIVREVDGMVTSDLGVVRILAPVAGELQTIAVRDRSLVRSGDPLFEIRKAGSGDVAKGVRAARSALLRKQLEAARRARDIEQERLATKTINDHDVRLQHLRAARDSIADRIEIMQRRKALAETALLRIETLKDQDLTVAERLHDARDRVAQISLEMGVLESARISLLTEFDQLRFEIDDAPRRWDLLESQAIEQETSVELAIADLETDDVVTLSAPVSGVTGALSVTPGKAVQPGEELASLVPEGGELVVEFHVTSDVIGLIEEGTEVRLRYDSYPYEQFGIHDGVVTAVTYTSMMHRDNELGDVQRFRVTVMPEQTFVDDGQRRQDLQPNMTLKGTFVLYRKTLLEAMLAPLLRAINGING